MASSHSEGLSVPPSSECSPRSIEKSPNQLNLLIDNAPRGRFPLVRLPVDIFRSVSSLVAPQDIAALWFTGDHVLQRLMGAFGGVEELHIELPLRGIVGAPFGFGGNFSRLTSFHLHSDIFNYQFARYTSGNSTDLSALPPTLTHLSLTSDSSFFLLIDRDEVVPKVQERKYSMLGAKERLGERFEIYGFETPKGKDSRLFYNLNQLFPNLLILELGSSSPNFFPKDLMKWLPKFQTTVPIEIAFFQSLPHSLTKLNAWFPWNWSYHSIQHLPASVTDVSLFRITFPLPTDPSASISEINASGNSLETSTLESTDRLTDSGRKLDNSVEDSQDDENALNSDLKSYEIPFDRLLALPETIKRIKTNVDDDMTRIFLERIPSELEALHLIGGDCVNVKLLEMLPKTLKEVRFQEPKGDCSLADLRMLPTELTLLRIDPPRDGELTLAQANDSPFWTRTLTDLKIAPSLHSSVVLFNSVKSLPLVRLHVEYTVGDASSHQLTKDHIEGLPATLKTLIIYNAVLHPDAWRVLPRRLSKLAIYFSYWLSGEENWVQTIPAEDLPRSLTSFRGSLTPSSQSATLLSLYRPGLRKLRLMTFPKLTEHTPTLPPPSPIENVSHTLLELHLCGPRLISQYFTAHLPRTLVSLTVVISAEYMESVHLLPNGLHTLKMSCHLFAPDIANLPRALTYLSFAYRKRPDIDEDQLVKDNVLAISSLPRSLIQLTIKAPGIKFSHELPTHLPAGLVRFQFTGNAWDKELDRAFPTQILRAGYTNDLDLEGEEDEEEYESDDDGYYCEEGDISEEESESDEEDAEDDEFDVIDDEKHMKSKHN